MNPTRKTKLEDLVAVERVLRERESLPQPQRIRQRLRELQNFVALLEATDVGKRELASRRVRYGDCSQKPQEPDADYYCRLRNWLDGGP